MITPMVTEIRRAAPDMPAMILAEEEETRRRRPPYHRASQRQLVRQSLAVDYSDWHGVRRGGTES